MLQARIACTLFCVSAGCVSASAQELSEHEFLAEFPTVLSASRLRQNASETPQSVTVIDQAMIKASGAREFAELFRLVPGFTVSYVTYVKGLQPIVTYHGLGREFFSRLQVLIDGRSINNATLGGVDWSEFPFTSDDIDRIEVIRGPSNATQGIGAFLATINFITKHALQERGFETSAGVGNDGIRDDTVRLGNGMGELDYRFVAGHRADDGFANVADSRRRNFASARADWQISQADNLQLQAGGTDGANQISAGGLNDPQRSAYLNTAYAQAKWDRSTDVDNGLFIQLYYYYFKLTDSFLPLPSVPGVEPAPIDGGSTVSRTDLEVQQNFSSGPNLRWVWGGGIREDKTQVPLLFSGIKPLRVDNLFGHVEWRASDALLANAGAMLEDNNLTGTDIAPQLALNYQLSANQTLRFNLARALRTPTVIENQGQFAVGAPGTPRYGPPGDLLPETILSREISYAGEWPEQHATLDLKLFDDSVHDLIDLIGMRNDSAAEAFPKNAVNGDSARERGVEGQLVWRPSAGSLLLISLSHLDIASADRLDSYSTSAPRNSAHLLVSHRYGDSWDVSFSVHAQSAFRAAGYSEPQRAFCRVDTRIAHQFPLWGGDGEVAVSLENLLDSRYTEYRQDDIGRRRVWATFGYKLPR
ncbi:MAG: TonB-dependent receptor plug domain-containing protein [Rudaea sp.]